jgi:plasmid stabilization system protein ParE
MEIQLSKAAANDIREIETYTLSKFGASQTLDFLGKLEDALTLISTQPAMGTLRPEFDPPNHQFRYQAILRSFVVVYEEHEGRLRVARIIHGSRNLLSDLLRECGDGTE